MKKNLLFGLIFLGYSASAQISNPHCDGTRYINQVFPSHTLTSGIEYGQNTTFCGAEQNMLLDIYEPAGDTASKRPVLIVNFGGSFIGGSRTAGDVVSICKDFARRGYVTVAPEYRLFGFCGLPNQPTMLDVVVKAVGDQKAAIRFMREHASEYRIDTNFVFLSGISAGAILALHTAYIDDTLEVPDYVAEAINNNGGIEGNTSNNYQYNSSVQGVWSMSGGLHFASWIDANDPLLINIHETGDATVPYDRGFAQVSGINIIELDGGNIMHQRTTELSKPDVFFSIDGNGHTAYIGKPYIMDSLKNSAARVFEAILCGNTQPDFVASLDINAGQPSFTDDFTAKANNAFPNPAQNTLTISLNTIDNLGLVSVFDLQGRILPVSIQIMEEKLIIDVSVLENGTYFLKTEVKENTFGQIFTVQK